jgi:hypothetical protein
LQELLWQRHSKLAHCFVDDAHHSNALLIAPLLSHDLDTQRHARAAELRVLNLAGLTVSPSIVAVADVGATSFVREYLSNGNNACRVVVNRVPQVVVVMDSAQVDVFRFERSVILWRRDKRIDASLFPLLAHHFA